MQGQKSETVHHFMYISAMICDECSRRELLYRAAQIAASLARLKQQLERKEHQC